MGADLKSLQTKLEIYQRLNREWAGHFTPVELAVLSQIMDRTIGWGKIEAHFTISALGNGDSIYGGLKMHRATVFRSLATLEERGMIHRRADPAKPDKIYFRINLDWVSCDAVHCSDTPSRSATPPVADHDCARRKVRPYIQVSDTDNQDTDNHCAAPADREPLNPAKIIPERSEKAVSSRTKAKLTRQEPPTGSSLAAEVEAAWRDALRETFPDAVEPVWTGREKAQAKRLAKGWAHHRQIAFIDFTDWAIRHWTAIMRKQFKWMTKAPPPAVPAFSFYVAMIDQFAECWGEGKLEKWASAKERTEIERRMSRGMTFEQATADYAKQHAMGKLRDEMRDREIKVRARSRAADAKLKQAEQLAEFGGKPPVHPRSIAAQEMRAKARQSDAPAVPAPNGPDETMPPLSAPMVDPNENPFD